MQEKSKSFVYLHISVFLFGFTAILGDLISINFISIVWWRSFITVFIFLFIIRMSKLFRYFSLKNILQHLFIGFLLGVHWLGFYGAIKIANPTIALIALSSSSLITALAEPLINRKVKWSRTDIIFGLLIIPGFILIFNNTSSLQKTGLLIGLGATLLGSIYSILNKKWLVAGHEFKMSFIHLFSVWVLMSVIFAGFSNLMNMKLEIPVGIDWFYFAIFTVICTLLSYFLYLKSMIHLNAFDVSLAFNMEPIYGILMAAFLLQDYKNLSSMVYIGMLFITAIVFLDLFIKLNIKVK
ncbi:MAG: DMT family transporter [Deltaproteobacteria bacterium]